MVAREPLMPDPSQVPAEDAPPKKGDRWLKVIYWAVGVLAVLAVLGAFWLRHIDAEHQKILREARSAVEGLRVPEVPDEDNAARLYGKAYTLFSISPQDISSKYTNRLESFDLEIGSDEIAKLLTDNAAALAALAQAAEEPHCVFVTDYSAGVAVKLPSLLHARAASLLLAVAARRAAHDGKHAEAAERIRQALCLSRGIAQPRTLITHLIGGACEDVTIIALRDTLTQTEPDAKSLHVLLAILAEHVAKRPTLQDALHGERLSRMLSAAEITANPGWRLTPRGFSGLSLRDARTCEKIWDWAERMQDQPAHEAFQEWRRTDHTKQLEKLGVPYSLIMPAFPAGFRSWMEHTGLLRCARLAVACRLHKLRAGALPADLKELAGFFPKDFAEVSADPFSGRPMLYQRSETGFVVYSVGAWDPRDNGAPDPYVRTNDPDLTFAVDPKLWAEYRAERVQALQKRAKPGPPPKPGVAAPRPPPPAR